MPTADDMPEPEPEPIKATLHEHQKEGLRWMVRMYDNGMPLVLVSSPMMYVQPVARRAATWRCRLCVACVLAGGTGMPIVFVCMFVLSR